MGEGETSTVGGEGPWRLCCLAAAVATAEEAVLTSSSEAADSAAVAATGTSEGAVSTSSSEAADSAAVAATGTSEGAVSTSSSEAADSAAVAAFSEEAADLANSAVVRAAAARAAVLLGRLARFTVGGWSGDGGDLATSAKDGLTADGWAVQVPRVACWARPPRPRPPRRRPRLCRLAAPCGGKDRKTNVSLPLYTDTERETFSPMSLDSL